MKNLKKVISVKIVIKLFITIVLLMTFSCNPEPFDEDIYDNTTVITGEDKGEKPEDNDTEERSHSNTTLEFQCAK